MEQTQTKPLPEPFKDWPNDAAKHTQYFAGQFETTAEQREPIELPVIGSFPLHVAGVLYRTGPASYKLVPQSSGSCKVLYNSRRQVDALIEEVRKTGSLRGMTFGQKRDPCANFFQKVKAVFETHFETTNPEMVNVGVTVHANVPGIPSHLKVPSRQHGQGGFARLTTLTDANLIKHIDPETLEPLGVTRQAGLHPALKGPLSSAHAELDPLTGDLYNYNLAFGRHATYRVFRTSAATGKTETLATITGPGVQAAYLHSFFLSRDYVILCVWPALFVAGGVKVLWERNLLDAMRFDPETPTRWYVVDRKAGRGVVATFASPAFFSFHTINAWQTDDADGEEEGPRDGTTDIICDLIQYPTDKMLHRVYYESLVSTGPKVEKYSGSDRSRPRLVRYRLSGIPSTGHRQGTGKEYGKKDRPYATWPQATAELTIASDAVGDLSTINPRFTGRKTRFVYNFCTQGKSSFFDGIAKVDVDTQESTIWSRDRHTPGEAIFVPEPGAEAEDAGFLLSVVLNGDTGMSYLLCLDARTMTEVARAECEAAVGCGFHGSHYPAK
ncbi:hypothetical protein BP00DRAFT_497037 [Aspergillus indologenus CBS 114.80]|uniref:Dioxygenase n=1 Tax=Aspergillus indologenus CBS 114.80 TaxID=1450541 RepID=A0A2V5HYF9_9EURO|nr:hypothetical protein BP00DRAFT_497037 [Aspergillus indologenus CBS 114.80]